MNWLVTLTLAFFPIPTSALYADAPTPTIWQDHTLLHEYNQFESKVPWLETTPCGSGNESNAMLDEKSICSYSTIEELFAWASGAGSDCRGETAKRWYQNYLDSLAKREAPRLDLYRRILAAPPEIQEAAYEIFCSQFSESFKIRNPLAAFIQDLRIHVAFPPPASPAEAAYQYLYFQTGYWRINSILRQNTRVSTCIQPLTDAITSAFAKLPRYRGTLWRGLSLTPTALQAYQPGQLVRWAAFSSTSIDRQVAESFADSSPAGTVPVLFKINAKHCLVAASASHMLEQEVLCLPGTQFKVLGQESPNVMVLEEFTPAPDRRSP